MSNDYAPMMVCQGLDQPGFALPANPPYRYVYEHLASPDTASPEPDRLMLNPQLYPVASLHPASPAKLTPPPPNSDLRTLAASLVPMLRGQCKKDGGCLSEITWFRVDWQRGGAATGNAIWTDASGIEFPVILKLPIVQRELNWTRHLQPPEDGTRQADLVVPRLLASGGSIGGYDLAWIVIEKFPHGPLGLHWEDEHIPRIADAAARFHAATRAFPVDDSSRLESWEDLIKQAQESVRVNTVVDGAKWKMALKGLRHQLKPLVEEWRARPVEEWIHGDLHFANAMTRTDDPDSPVALIDLAEVRPGHWIEDAVYLERQLWARPERMKKYKPVKAIAKARKSLGLPVEKNHPRLAMVKRALLAGTAPAFIRSEGQPEHFAACLTWLERALDELK